MVISLVWQSKTCEVRSETSRECDDFRSHGFPFYYCSLGRFHWFDFFRSVACVRFFAFFLLVWVPERNRCSLINQKRGRSVSNGEYGCMFINCIHANSLCSRIYYRACFLTTFQGCNFTEEREISGRKMSVLGRGGWGRRCCGMESRFDKWEWRLNFLWFRIKSLRLNFFRQRSRFKEYF